MISVLTVYNMNGIIVDAVAVIAATAAIAAIIEKPAIISSPIIFSPFLRNGVLQRLLPPAPVFE